MKVADICKSVVACRRHLTAYLLAIIALMSSKGTAWQPATQKYFAFGSNMLPATMKSLRNIEPCNATAAILPGFQLRFDVPGSPLLEPSAASVRRTFNPHDVVHGVVYELTESDFDRVGRTEGVPFAYQWETCLVYPYVGDGECAGNNAVGVVAPIEAQTLISGKTSSSRGTIHIPTSPSYLRILRQGAAYWSMDRSYQISLSKITTANNLLVPDGLSGTLLQIAKCVNPKKE
jgi:hypothetical protein